LRVGQSLHEPSYESYVKLLRFLISGFWLSLATLIIVIGLLVSAARLLLPELGKYHDEVAAWVGEALGQPVKIGALGAGWHGLGPSLELRDVTVLDAAGKQPVLQCAAARIDINLWESLIQWQFEPGQLTVSGLRLAVVRRADGSIRVMGLGAAASQTAGDVPGEETLERWLQHQERLAIEDSSLEWRDLSAPGKTLEFSAVNLQLRNQEDRHRVDGSVDLPASLGRHLQVAADVRGDLFTPKAWLGKVFARGSALRLGDWWGDQARLGIASVQGTADFQAWSTWGDGVQQVEGDIHAQSLQVTPQAEAPAQADAPPPAHLALAGVRGGFRWQRRTAGWAVDVDHFVIAHRDLPEKPAQLRVEYAEDKAGGRRVVQAAYSELDAEDVAEVLLAAQAMPAEIRERLAAMDPHGELSEGYLRYRSEPRQAPQFLFHTRFNDLAWQPVSRWPGAEGVSGSITANEDQGAVTLATEKAKVDFADLFRGPLPLDALAGKVYWAHDAAGWRVLVRDVTARNEDVNVKVSGYLDKPQADGSPYLDLTAAFGDGKGDHVSRYLPAKIMPASTVAWVDKAIVNGRVSGGSVRFYGRLADFPFDDGQGLFEIRFDVTDGILDYAAGWPRLEDVETEILFHDRRFEAHATSAKSLDSEVLQAFVTIPDLSAHPALLTVDGEARGPAADAVRYITESPLNDKLGAYLSDVSAGGRSHLQLSLKLPLGEQVSKLKGALRISDGSLLFNAANIDVTHINGSLNFSERGLAADQIHADLLGQAMTVSAKTTTDQDGATTTFSAQGTMDAAAAAKRFAAPLAAYVDGTAPWHGELRIPPRSAGWMELDVASPLQGVAVNLPAPMGKTAEETRKLSVQMPLPFKAGKPLHVRYGELADAQLALSGDKGGLHVGRGEVRFGAGVAVLPSQAGVRVVGSLPEFDETQWAAILNKATAGQQPNAAPAVNHVDVAFGTLKVAGRQLDKARLQADRGDGAWDINIDSEQAAGRIHVPDAEDAPLVMNMDRLYLAQSKEGGEAESGADPRKARPLQISAKSFHYDNLDLGELHVSATRKPAGLSFDDLHAHSAQRDLKISGQWVMEDDQPQSSFKVAYNGDDAGNTLTALGFAGMIKGGKTHTDAQLQWPGSPADFALAKAKGSISLEIKDGRLLDVEPGAGRILGLLSFQALPRRLLLDFSDLFQKGFSFDSLAGSFTIEKGNAYTDNLYMEGPAARLDARGRVGLAAEDYDQLVTVIPNISSGLPVAGALAGGVGAGAALFLVEKLIKPGIDKIIKVDYKVTGPWANPTVTRITAGQPETPPEQKKR
jgi:uncharacterized protein (TIGR02099 family)